MLIMHPRSREARDGLPVSLARRVADLVVKRGSATVDDLMPDMPGCTRQQVLHAMKNARGLQLIHCETPMRKRQGTIAPMHYPGPRPEHQAPRRDSLHRDIQVRPPNSAWELAHGRQIAGAWPPEFAAGRRYELLGGWNEDEQASTAQINATEPR